MKVCIGFKNFCVIFLTAALIFSLSGCEEDSSPGNVNLIFVVSSDLAYNAPGDISQTTANLTGQGLHRSLLMATYLKETVLENANVTSIYALEPMTHLQTANKYPDMTAIGSIQHFALLNQHTVAIPPAAGYSSYTAYSYPIKVSYADGSVPAGVALPDNLDYCPDCTGLDFNDTQGNNADLVNSIIDENKPGYYVFSAPWETTRALMEHINQHYGYALDIPASYKGPNYVYEISIPQYGDTRLITYNSNLAPLPGYPDLPAQVTTIACTPSPQTSRTISLPGGVAGAVIPANITTNATVYIVRHAEAHPDTQHAFENGNFVAAGQWRALDLPSALAGKIAPDMVYSCDPAQWYSTEPLNPSDYINVSYVRPSLTVWPYVVANDLPYHLASSISLGATSQAKAKEASDFFFTNGTFSNQTILLAWESSRIKPIINALLRTYDGSNGTLLDENWPSTDYNTIWTVKLDGSGNLTVDNALCEGIDSNELPEQAPPF